MALRADKLSSKGAECAHTLLPHWYRRWAMYSGDWGDYFRWPSRGEGWSAWAWLLLVPKVLLAIVAWVVVIGVILAAVSAPAAATALLAYVVGLSGAPAAILVTGVSLVTLYFAADLLDL